MAKSSTKEESASIIIQELQREHISIPIVGTTPLIHNRLSEKAKRELLFPANKTKADRAATLKHDPLKEYRDAAYTALEGDPYPTRILVCATAFKRAMAQAAIDVPGNAAKTQIGRLTTVEGQYVPVFGIPELMLCVVRNSDMKRTPDIRTHMVQRHWACTLSISYVTPVLNRSTIVNLLSAAGIIVGIGDWRQEKGSGNYGLFRVANPDDPEFLAITKSTQAQQDAAIENPAFFDKETADLYKWFNEQLATRGNKATEPKQAKKK